MGWHNLINTNYSPHLGSIKVQDSPNQNIVTVAVQTQDKKISQNKLSDAIVVLKLKDDLSFNLAFKKFFV